MPIPRSVPYQTFRPASAVPSRELWSTPIRTHHPTWFGPTDEPLLGAVHIPESGHARAAVVLCPPIGKEHIDTYLGVKLLAERLCDRGLLAVRFDYYGCGDSSGDQADTDALARWQRSVVHAVALARSCGAETVSLVGLRAGALFAAAAAAECGPINSLVLWDPALSGRGYLREQRAYYKMGVGVDDPADPRISVMGGVLAPEAADALSSISIDGATLTASSTLLATRSSVTDTPPVRRLAAALGADELTLHNHEAFTSPPSFFVEIPSGHITEIADWICAHSPSTRTPAHLTVRRSAQVSTTATGLPVCETIENIGPNSLFAIRTHPAVAVGTAEPGITVLFHATAKEHRIGPGRLWVEMAREIAALGVPSLRFDRRGTGNTGLVDPDEPTPIYSDESDQDARAAAAAACASPQNLIMAGLCSGAWNSASVALDVRARAVVLVNMILWSVRRRESLRDQVRPEDILVAADSEIARGSLRSRGKALLQQYLPYPAWRMLGRLGITQVPEVMLEALRSKGVRTTVVLSPADHSWFIGQRGEESLRRLRRRGFTGPVSIADVGDHPGYHRDLREHIRAQITTAVTSECGVIPLEVRTLELTTLDLAAELSP